MRISVRVRLVVFLSADEALCNLGTFAFVASHIFYEGRRHSSVVAKLLCIIESLEDIHTEVQGMILSLHQTTTLIYDVSWRWSQYLNMCLAASASKVVEAPGGSIPLFLKPILVDLEGVSYIGPILPVSLANLVTAYVT